MEILSQASSVFEQKCNFYMYQLVSIDSKKCLPLLIFALASQFHIYLLWVNICLAKCLKCDSTSRRFQPGEGAFSVIVKTSL